MKRVLLLLALISLATAGCQAHRHHGTSRRGPDCGPGGQGQYAGCGVRNQADYVPQIPHNYHQQTGPAGPPTAANAYPYYTTRGPRDFFLDQPSTIGY